jgi:hypothetical protein
LHGADPTESNDLVAQSTRYREVKFRHSREFVPILDGLGISLLVSS